MIQTKEFDAGGYIDKKINSWIKENSNIKVIDIKYCVSGGDDRNFSNALLIYETES